MKHAGGRPTKYDKRFHPLLAQSLGQNGKTDEEIAGALNIAVSTLNDWKHKYPEFSESLKKGKTELVGRLEHALYRRAEGYEYTEIDGIPDPTDPKRIIPKVVRKRTLAPDTGALAFSLKNLAPKKWRDRHEIVGGDETSEPVKIKVVNNDDRRLELKKAFDEIKGNTTKSD
jgi:hypothetical protein